MSEIDFSKEEKQRMVLKVQKYINEELDCEAGSFEVESLIDNFINEFGAVVYNRALADVHAHLANQMDAMSESIYDLEKPAPYSR